MKDQEKSLEIRSKFYAVLSEIHGEKLTIGLQIVEAKNGMIFFYPIIQEITNILNKNNILIKNQFNEILEFDKNINRIDQTTLNPMVLGDCACFFVNANSISKNEFINLVKHLMTKHKVNYDIHFQSCYYETDNYVDGGTKLYKGYVPRLLENIDKKNPNRTIISVQKNNELGR